MPSVGTAYVNVRVNTRTFETSLDSVMKRLSAKMEKAGTDLGKDFERGLKKTNFDATFDRLTSASDKATSQVGYDINRITTEAREAKDAVGDMAGELRGASSASRRLKLGGIGGGGGGGLRQSADDAGFFRRQVSALAGDVPRATAVISQLYNAAAFGGTALAGAAGGLSAAAQGIFAIGANAAAAAPAVGILTNAVMSLAQVGGVAALASSGVGKALSAGFKAVAPAAQRAGKATGGMGKATQSMARAVAAASRAVRDAKQNLADAYRDAARAAEDAARRVRDAERALVEAQRETLIAQRALNAARAEAIEQLEDIGFAAEDAALAEDRAALTLADAYQELLAVSELAPDDRMRVEAELAFKEAELNMRVAKDRRQDADKDQRQAAKSGIEGTEAMQDAHENLADAQKNEADAARDLNDARREQARTAEDNARRIADAQQALADAQRGLADAQRGLATGQREAAAATQDSVAAVDAYGDALAKLGPNQQAFVKRIIGMRDEFNDFRNAVAEPLFGRLLTAMDILNQRGKDNKTIMDVVQTGLIGTAEVMGDTAIEAAKLASNDVFQESLGDAMESNNIALRHFGQAGVYLADAFVQVADAAGPLFIRFSKWVESVAKGWSETTRLKNSTNDLTKTINTAGDRVSEFWGLAKELWRTLMILGRAANNAANGFGYMDQQGKKQKGYIPSLTDSLDQFNDRLRKNPGLIAGFTQSLQTLNAVGRAFKNAIIDPLVSLGQDKNIEKAFNTIARSGAFDRLSDAAADALPAMADLLVAILDIFAAISESGGIRIFMETLATGARIVADALGAIAGNRYGRVFLGIAAGVFAVIKAVKLMRGVVRTVILGTLGPLIKGLDTAFKKRKFSATGGVDPSAPSKVAGAGAEAKEGTWEANVIRGLTAIKLAVDACCIKLNAAMGRMAVAGAAGGAGGGLLTAAPKAGRAAGGAAAAAAAGGAAGAARAGALGAAAGTATKVGKFATVIGKVGKVLGPVMKILGPFGRIIGFILPKAFGALFGPIGIIVMTLLPLLWPLLQKLNDKFHIVEKVMGAVKWALEKLGDGFEWLWEKIKDLFGWLKDNWPLVLAILTGPIGLAVRFISQNFDKIVNFAKELPGKVGNFLRGIWNDLSEGLSNVWTRVKGIWNRIVVWVKGRPAQFMRNLRLLWAIFGIGLSRAWDRVKTIWSRIVAWVKGRPDQFMRNLRFLWAVFRDKLSEAWTRVKNLWTTITTWVKGRPAQFKRNLSGLWSYFREGLGTAWTRVKNFWEDIKDKVGNWPGQMKRKLTGMWDGIKTGLKTSYNWVAGKVNTYLVGGLNKILGHFNASKISGLKKFAEGGPVIGPGGGKDDKVLAALSHGEYVMPTAAAKKLGPDTLDYMRKHGSLPPMGDVGSLFGSLWTRVKDAAGAIGKGAEYAVKWALSKASNQVSGHGIISRIVLGMMNAIKNKVVSWGENKDKDIARAKAAKRGGATVIVTDPNNPAGKRSWGGGIFTNRFIAHMQKAQSMANVAIHVTQGGWRPATSYSGTSHAGDAIDLQVSAALIRALRRVGIAAGDRTGKGNWGPHVHAIPGPKAGYARGSAVWQWQDYVAKGGAKQSLTSPWGLAKGGVVMPSAHGTLALIAEAGRAERVTPLDSEGFTPAERRMLEALENRLGGGDGGDTYNVHPSRGMNEAQLADMVARRVAWNRRRGAGRR